MNDNYEFSGDKQQERSGTMSSITSARAQRDRDIREYTQGNRENQILKDLDEQINKLKEVKSLTKAQRDILAEAQSVQKQMNDFTSITVQNYDEFLKKNKDAISLTQKLNREIYSIDYKEHADNEEYINKLIRQRSRDMEHYSDLVEKINKQIETNKEGSKSQLKAFTDELHNLKTEIKDLAVIKGVGDITQGLFDKGSSSNQYNVYRNVSSQLGISQSQFNTFKRDLVGQLQKSDNFFNFGWKDTADYLNKLGELGITNQQMAEEQYLAVIQGTKYLGLTTETQAKILKIAKDTNRMDLLQTTNETMVQIMNAQLGVSKDQLNQMVNQSAGIADMSVFLGGNGDAIRQLTQIQAAVTKEYGKATSDAAMNILSEVMSNPANNKYLTNGFLGGDYNKIVQYAQAGQMDEAIKTIINSVQSSNATRVARENIYTANALGADNNIMAIANSQGSMQDVNRNMADINNASNDIAQTIKEFNQDWSDKIINAGSNILSLLPFSQVLTLQNTYYALATLELLTKLPITLKVFGTFLKTIAFNTSKMAPGLDGSSPTSLQSLLGTSLSPLVSIAAGVASIAMFANDYMKGKDNAKDWGTSDTAAAIGGAVGGTDKNTLSRVIKNAVKYGLAGAAIGSIFPGIGNVAGWVIGTLAGLAIGAGTGLIGGKNIANGLDDMFGRSKTEKGTGSALAPVTSTPSSSRFNGRGAPISQKDFPWYLSSPYGPRGVIQTKAGPTQDFHNGIDLASSEGTPIGANNAGIVTASGTASDGANYVTISSGDGLEEVYWHLMSPSHLKRGEHVNEGQLIGYMGMTGMATGPHLHFGMRHAGTQNYINPIDRVNSGTFYPTETGYTSEELKNKKDAEKLLESVISSDTLSTQAQAVANSGVGDTGSQDIVYAVNSGFASLNDKLDELSNRQDNQEEVLKQLTSSRKSSIYGY